MKPLFIKKNGTVSKVSGIIMNLIPSYTMAEYNALTHKPLFWVRTDEDYAQIPASDVSYGSGSVEDALDGKVTEAFRANAKTIPANSSATFDFTDSTKYTTRKAYLLFAGQAYQSSNSRFCAIVLTYTSASVLIPIFKDGNITLTMSNGVLTVAVASQQTNVGLIDLGYFMG